MQDEEKKLYPLKFCPIQDKYEWGEEEFLLADLGYRDSFVKGGWLGANTIGDIMDMYMDRVVGEGVFDNFGRQFPFQIKRLSVNGKCPITVCPPDDLASQRYDALGKEKVWYILSAGEGAGIHLGFSRDTDAGDVYEECDKGTVERILNFIPVKAGESYSIPAGVVHSAHGKMEILEVSESSGLDFSLSGPSLVEALDFINYSKQRKPVRDGRIRLQQFCCSIISPSDPVHIYSEKFDSCFCYHCIEGEALIKCGIDGTPVPYSLKKGETILVPAEIPDFVLSAEKQGTRLLEVFVEKRQKTDPYINPDAQASLEEDDTDKNILS